MSAETMLHFLNNCTPEEKFGFRVVTQCAPVLKGVKISNLITMKPGGWRKIRAYLKKSRIICIPLYADAEDVYKRQGFKVVNYSGSTVSGTWSFSVNQGEGSASSIYPEVNGTTAYQVEFSPEGASEGQYGNRLKRDVVPKISPKELTAVLSTPIEKNYDRSTRCV